MGRHVWRLILVCLVAAYTFIPMVQFEKYHRRTKDQPHNSTERKEEAAANWHDVVITTKPHNNNQNVAYIAYGSFNKGPARFQIMIIDSLRTWLQDNIIYYVLNKNWKPNFEKACNELANREECKRIVPIYVDCPEGYYGQSPCCKMDQGMTVMWENYSHYDWYSYQDDDMYIRTAYMNDYLSALSPEEPMVLTSKSPKRMGQTWGADARNHANCSKDLDFLYAWGQPAIYSKAGLKLMFKAFQMGAIAKQCKAFGVTHDVGNPIVHWMVSLPHLKVPSIPDRPPKNMTTHLGAHKVGQPSPNMTEIHAQIGHVEHPPPPYEYSWHRPNGFLQTNTYKLHGNVSEWTEWHTMPVSDCRAPIIEEKMPLRNNKTVAYITFGSFEQGSKRFHTMIIDSLRTWLEGNVIFYVLNEQWKTRFEEACQDPSIHDECQRIIPIFVNCPEGYYGPSPCCKMDKGMSVMWANYSYYDWYSYQDDDMYIRTEYMDGFLSGLSPDEPMVLTSQETWPLGKTFGGERTNCSTNLDFMYPWGQPAMYSRVGLERMFKAFQMGAVAKQCESFVVTHDVGNPLVHWMMGLPEVRLPNILPHPPATWTGRNVALLGAHGVGRGEYVPNMTKVHAQIGHVQHPPPPYEYYWHRPTGFLQTTTYKLHGNVSEWTEWHTMNASDCQLSAD